MDEMVLKTQKWLNNNYSKYGSSRFPSVDEDGQTGWGTINGLIRALQIELGIEETADNFGGGTVASFNAKYPNGIAQQADSDKTESNVYGIIQGGLWCKGYSTGSSSITKHFYDGTGSGIKELRKDAGISSSTSTVTLNVMKALLSMDQFVTLVDYGGTEQISTIQRRMNARYEDYIGLSPCDGLYGRRMNESMIKVLQAIEGYSVEDATGNFGDGTKANLYKVLLPSSGNEEAFLLARYALCCNGYSVEIYTPAWDATMESKVLEFQSDLALPQTGTVDVNTWMSLLLSKGNPDRACEACDTRFEITNGRLQHLNANGYNIVGRYLSGGDFKELRKGELQRLVNAGKKVFLIFQESGSDPEYFNPTNAAYDAESAVAAARNYGVKKGNQDNTIYFAVDFDAQDAEIETMILPYFQTLKNVMEKELGNSFKVGVYGTRNVCQQVINNGYATTAFVSDMSTGYSGNMGFKIPKEWTFDQFYEYEISDSTGTWGIDKVAYSGYSKAVGAEDVGAIGQDSGGCIQAIRDGRDNMFLEEVTITNGIGRYFRVLSNSIDLEVSYQNLGPSPEAGYGMIWLTNAYTGEVLNKFNIFHNQTGRQSIPVSYGDVYEIHYISTGTGTGQTQGLFTTYITTAAIL